MLRREREEMGKMRQFRVDHNVGESVGRFGAPDTAPKRRRDPTAPYPVARHPSFFRTTVCLGLVVFFARSPLVAGAAHHRVVRAAHECGGVSGAHFTESLHVRGFRRGEGGRWSLPAEVVATIGEALPYSFKRC